MMTFALSSLVISRFFMFKWEADRIELALDGLIANIETLRAVIGQSVDEKPATGPTEPFTGQLQDSGSCPHPNLKEIETMGGNKSYCFECGYAQ